jgi:hypothetical protein
MGRIKLVLALTAVTLAMLVASIPSALAASPPEDSIVFFPVPLGNGATYSCAGDPPFVANGDDSASGNCSVEQIGPPADLVCDVPTTIKFMHDMHSFVGDASICHSSPDEPGTPA